MDVLAFLCCLGSCGTVGDVEFTAAYIQVLRIGKHHPFFLQASMRGNGVVRQFISNSHTPFSSLTFVTVPEYLCTLTLSNTAVLGL